MTGLAAARRSELPHERDDAAPVAGRQIAEESEPWRSGLGAEPEAQQVPQRDDGASRQASKARAGRDTATHRRRVIVAAESKPNWQGDGTNVGRRRSVAYPEDEEGARRGRPTACLTGFEASEEQRAPARPPGSPRPARGFHCVDRAVDRVS